MSCLTSWPDVRTRLARSPRASLIILRRLTVEEIPYFLLEIGEVDFQGFDGFGDFLETHFLVWLVRAVDRLLVAVLLDNLAAVSDLIEAQRC